MLRLSTLAFTLAFALNTGAQALDLSKVGDADREKINAALPTKPRVQPKQPRKLLVFNLARGFSHGSIPFGAVAFQALGEKTGAFTAVLSDDIAVFEPESLKQFDAVLMNNTTGDLFAPQGRDKLTQEEQAREREREARLKQSFVDFVAGGGGLIGVHAATDCLYKWEAYGDMLGGYFWGHPWNEEVAVKLDDPGHPLCQAFNGQGFRVADEIYQFRDPYSREKLRVLLSLDTEQTNMDKGDKLNRTDGDFAVSWIHAYGKGRVFYCSLGHRNEIFWNPAIMQFYLDGIQYALGDLPVDAKPSAELTEAYVQSSRVQGFQAGIGAIFEELAQFKLGDAASTATARTVDKMVVEAQQPGNEVQRQVLVEKLSGLLTGNATTDSKVYACRKLQMIGTEAAVPSLAPMLLQPELADMARYALQAIPGKAADDALLAALPKTKSALQVGVINSLGARRCAAATAALTPLLSAADAEVAQAAAAALGQVGTAEAATALQAARAGAAGPTQVAIDQALLACASRLDTQAAAKVYDGVYQSDASETIRAAAFRGLMLAKGEAAIPDVLAKLKGERDAFAEAAGSLVAELPGAAVTKTFAAALDQIPVTNRPLVIDALVERGGAGVGEALLAQVSSADEAVAVAALRGMESLGGASAILPLAQIATQAEDRSPRQRAARLSLERMGDDALSVKMAELLPDASAPVRAELIRTLGVRKAHGAVPVILRLARQADEAVREQAFDALRGLAQPAHLPALVDLALTASDDERTALEDTIIAVAHQVEDESQRPAAVLAALEKKPAAAVRASLLYMLGGIASPAGLPALYAALEDGDENLRLTALKALVAWPTPAPMDKLRDLSRTAKDVTTRVLALRGYAKELTMPGNRPVKETLALYSEALKLAEGEAEKKTLISGLGGLRHPDAMALLKPFLEDKTYQAEALVAAGQILEAMDGAAMVLTASRKSGDAKYAIDGDRGTRWTTGRGMQPGDWFQVDLGYSLDVEEILLDAGDTGTDYPRKYEVYISNDPENWGDPVLTGEGKERVFTVKVPPTNGRYVKLVQQGSVPSNYWSISELKINGMPRLVGTANELDRSNWKVTACRAENPGAEANAIDGDLSTRWSPGGMQQGGEWLTVDLGEERELYRVLLDATGSNNDYPRGYEVFISSDGEDWLGPIAKGAGTSAKTFITLLPRRGRYLKIVQTGKTDRNYWSIHELKIFGK